MNDPITLQLPQRRFDIGDTLTLDGLVLLVSDWYAQGRWMAHGVAAAPTVECTYRFYRLTAQGGSVARGVPVRPGTVYDLEMTAVDRDGVPVALSGPLTDPDTPNNILTRHQTWLAQMDVAAALSTAPTNQDVGPTPSSPVASATSVGVTDGPTAFSNS